MTVRAVVTTCQFSLTSTMSPFLNSVSAGAWGTLLARRDLREGGMIELNNLTQGDNLQFAMVASRLWCCVSPGVGIAMGSNSGKLQAGQFDRATV